jgi:hypothetical protein
VKTRSLVIGVSSLFLISCAQNEPLTIQRSGNLENYTVVLTANRGSTELKIRNGPKRCNNGKEGCMDFNTNKLGTVNFRFYGRQRERDCNTRRKADWVITNVQLSELGDPATDKGDFPNVPPQWLIDAFPDIDTTNGVIYASDYKQAERTVTFINLNNNDLADPKDIYYQVTATSCRDSSKTITIDPKIRNLGK